MRLVDTSAWIEWYVGSALGRKLADEIPPAADVLVPTIVQFELWKWLDRFASRKAAQLAVAESGEGKVVPLSTELAVRAALAAQTFRLSTADAIVYATARAHDVDLLTCDAHFRDLPGVIYFAKPDT